MQDLYVTWDDYNRLIEQLTLQIHASGYQFDSLLCLARGGHIPYPNFQITTTDDYDRILYRQIVFLSVSMTLPERYFEGIEPFGNGGRRALRGNLNCVR